MMGFVEHQKTAHQQEKMRINTNLNDKISQKHMAGQGQEIVVRRQSDRTGRVGLGRKH